MNAMGAAMAEATAAPTHRGARVPRGADGRSATQFAPPVTETLTVNGPKST